MNSQNTPTVVECQITPELQGAWTGIDAVLMDNRFLLTAKAIPMPITSARLEMRDKPTMLFRFNVKEGSKRTGSDGWTLNWYIIDFL